MAKRGWSIDVGGRSLCAACYVGFVGVGEAISMWCVTKLLLLASMTSTDNEGAIVLMI